MLSLLVLKDDKVFLRENVETLPIVIGREKNCTIRFLDPSISRQHCVVERTDEAIVIKDTSSNGTFLNGEKISSSLIRHGDVISVGPWTIRVEENTSQDANLIRNKTNISNRDRTKIISYDPSEKKLFSKFVGIEVIYKDSPSIKQKFEQPEILIGSSKFCDLLIEDEFVSRQHAKIISTAEGSSLIDLGSTNGTFFGSSRISKISLSGKGSFKVGGTQINFDVGSEPKKISASHSHSLGKLVGTSQAMRTIFSLIEKVAPTKAPVCIIGESGTGKELVARELHRLSEKPNGPFVAVNCAAIPAHIIESLLFGHERGAFTGAAERQSGLFEQANGGTIFLDEIGDMPLELQSRLLRVLETGTVRRLGGREEISVNPRLVCATNRNLKEMVSYSKFREDLFFRIFVVPIMLPALRERPDDIPVIAKKILSEMSPKDTTLTFDEDVLDIFCKHRWSGNVRELKNVIIRAIALRSSEILTKDCIDLVTSASTSEGTSQLESNERSFILGQIKECGGNLARAARKMGIARSSLQSKIKKLRIELDR